MPTASIDPAEFRAVQQFELAGAKADGECDDAHLAKARREVGAEQAATLVQAVP